MRWAEKNRHTASAYPAVEAYTSTALGRLLQQRATQASASTPLPLNALHDGPISNPSTLLLAPARLGQQGNGFEMDESDESDEVGAILTDDESDVRDEVGAILTDLDKELEIVSMLRRFANI